MTECNKSKEETVMMDPTDYDEHKLLADYDKVQIFDHALEESLSTNLCDVESVVSLLSECEYFGRELKDSEPHVQQHQYQFVFDEGAKPTPSPSTPKNGLDAKSSPETTLIDPNITPSSIDILCGQSRNCACHAGNCKFQLVLDSYTLRYQRATNKQEKMALTKEIVGYIRSTGGRFLRQKDGAWEEISTVAARDKVSHALRTKVASRKRKEQRLENVQNRKEPERRNSEPPSKPKGRTRRKRQQETSIVTAAGESPKPKNQTHKHRKHRKSSSAIITASFDASDPTTASFLDDFYLEL